MLSTTERYDATKRGQARVIDHLAIAAQELLARLQVELQETQDETSMAELEGALAEARVEVFRTQTMRTRVRRTGKPEANYEWLKREKKPSGN